MSEEKNRTDLKDEDLKKVSGGGGKPLVCTSGSASSGFETCPLPALKGRFQQCAACRLK